MRRAAPLTQLAGPATLVVIAALLGTLVSTSSEGYFIDSLFRKDASAPADAASPSDTEGPGSTAEVSRIFANMGKAVAAYEKTLQHAPSRLDRYIEGLVAAEAHGRKRLHVT